VVKNRQGNQTPAASPETPLLETENLNVFFRKRESSVQILSNVSFQIEQNEVFGLVGESGCGKSMTALSIMKLLPLGTFCNGKIQFYPSHYDRGVNLLSIEDTELTKIRGKEIGMIFQEPMTSLNPVYTIGSQIAEVLTMHEGCSRKEARLRAVELLSLVKIHSPELRIRDYPHQLSGGMRQRVMIAMAVACNPSLLIADEPTTALDVTIQEEILNLIFEIKKERGMSVLFITHDLALISENADRVAIMYAGRIVEKALVQILFQRPAHPYTIGLLNSLPVERGVKLTPISGSVPSPGELPRGCKFSPRCQYRIEACTVDEPALRGIEKDHLARCIRAEEIRAMEPAFS
jgi:oligopeptide/dipeptide ABC transporter ATP-binding protein